MDPSLKDTFLNHLRNKDNEGDYFLARARHFWATGFGKRVAQQTTELRRRKRTLFIYVNNSALRHELHMLREQIAKRLNEEAGEDWWEEVRIK
ncbi:MAG: DUF721 domain-containing protein [Bacteroidota bacterium]